MRDAIHARLDWDEQGQPRSSTFGDVYFSRASGLAETRHVFLASNRFSERCAALPAGGQLCVGETGFGTGLNFLCAWQTFLTHAPADARLQVISVEKYPLCAEDLARALALWPELADEGQALLAQYRAIHPGFQRLSFAGGRIQLTLLIGDALACLAQLDAAVDVWFLDGFAPAKNPQMWSPELFAELARLSAPGASLATFTAAGFVRRGLIAAGFAMRKVPGFGHKREMLAGERDASQPAAGHDGRPWYARPAARHKTRQALVIGGGLAGCSSAASLAARGWQVTLLERHAELAREASGNPQGVLYLKLSAHGTALSQLVVAGFGYTRRLLERLQDDQAWSACGVLQLAFDEREAARQQQLAEAFPPSLLRAVDRSEASTLAGVALEHGGLWFEDGGWVHPPALCRLQAAHPRIRVLTHQQALELRRVNGQWQAWQDDTLLAEAPVAVLCTASEVRHFPQAAYLPLKRIRGQISALRASTASAALRCVLCAEGYVAPARAGEHTLGASFNFQRDDLTPSAEEHADNLALLEQISPALHARLRETDTDPATLEGRVAFRSTTPDYLPLVGPLVEAEAFRERYAALRKDARQRFTGEAPWLDGLYVNAGHGSRGLISAPLCAELLAAWIEHEPLPLPRAVAEACHPSRFLLRELIRGR
ncbi:bifunctional tRNA (5-methylaminomethyl-2-thiouridine)(34)-methyltransferase MnmD/FAD-dependent 5-carboxymethylaminomethyl-2-thiouridine(34) oxidoreductase MnmC [Pseudomonas sp. NW5]|uniref:bifunctional tRNA (5-methylaminomethyl-2-thiouridine)(34)-methyltransferase MnmD/FAD-dependent 5-carboxymethylaminomethyl-2-thiouridine(34) oxidoreductase MnmC n=1 Tax=Pseudomonas sp. NW5 TaxID=2934934 RepID=UPI0020209574|nr:bifunctional tRNA (5-methylaminomethyl-2-thiouridine)(34)-methyltransferase MnmD/FAD-dependent 5-carboxymethylaminomethyl-2-thiouridine(34) oxidoreductase MnmC [Pseudomonas sp. NW5]MCL7461609.1 bifunctional tRNA (5-methylaminomethyl-2-thiouridine)(34)-methyltransferase MnmD/FAD-dependent 5-carboxymethylaminomethyl-2-thiouridine(34) oxidoreductase MnmC [Pseudomonas sp. NW5]